MAGENGNANDRCITCKEGRWYAALAEARAEVARLREKLALVEAKYREALRRLAGDL